MVLAGVVVVLQAVVVVELVVVDNDSGCVCGVLRGGGGDGSGNDGKSRTDIFVFLKI